MAQAPTNRDEEIQQIHQSYADFYKIGGGIFLVLIGVWIGSFFFSDGYHINIYTGFLSALTTIFVLDQLNNRRAKEERKRQLFQQLKYPSQDFAVFAFAQIQQEGWLEEAIKYHQDKAGRINLHNVRWGGGIDLQGVDLSGAILNGANLEGANLKGAILSDALLMGVNLQNTDLGETQLQGANLMNANLQGANLTNANLKGAYLKIANLQGADLTGTNLQKANLMGANLSNTTLMPINPYGCHSATTNLQGARMVAASLAGAILEQANLTGARLRGANLSGTSLITCNLSHSDLRAATLYNTILVDTNLLGANLHNAKFDKGTVLPNAPFNSTSYRTFKFDEYWTPETDMSRYTDSNHPDFWQPDWVKEQEE